MELGQKYARSERYFPLAYLVRLLEQTGAQMEWEVGFVHQTLLEVGVAITTLFGIYDRLFKAKVFTLCVVLGDLDLSLSLSLCQGLLLEDGWEASSCLECHSLSPLCLHRQTHSCAHL